ncbi:tRNA (N6-isopentenyl adenosine(37)-C2)-methylthiotransferase MiaB [Candidatus Sumerlaeota bacterium]|nr:tRNA (N6-isopentenyl adenosine(37)-C2)-methylthiotransferase MiaB [Candidatus Sumerlaeota bacterium]
MQVTYHITTFGYQMNQADTEMMEGIMAAKGWVRAAGEESADVLLFNTCVVREHAEERALARLNQLRKLKAESPRKIIGVTGCMAQKEAASLHEKLPHIDLVMGTRAIPRLGTLLDRILTTGEPQTCVEILDEDFPADLVPVRQKPLKALINITLGCNKNCSYCIVPATRGREVSIAPEKIVEEARFLTEHGYKEITLVGQNVNSYRGADVNGAEVDFGALLRRVNKAASGVRIRYITSHPRDCNEAHISAVADCENVCENFHLPVQSGSTRVLKKMYRGYSRERYVRLIERVRAAVPDATITTDIIVGFPGEMETEFEETLSLVEEVRYDSAYMYMYSTRPGTPASEKFEDHIPLAVKKERLARLIARQEQISAEINRAAIGSEVEVLVEDIAPRTPGDLLARTRGDKMVILPGPKEWIGRLMNVRIVDSNAHTLFARATESSSGVGHTDERDVLSAICAS